MGSCGVRLAGRLTPAGAVGSRLRADTKPGDGAAVVEAATLVLLDGDGAAVLAVAANGLGMFGGLICNIWIAVVVFCWS